MDIFRMITEDYVSFEVAKLLKEKGFNGECRAAYTNYGKLFTTQIQQYITNVLCSKGTLWDCTAPTHQMAMKWLREVHNIDIEIQAHVGMLGIKVYMPYVSVYTPYKLNDVDIKYGLTKDDVKGRVRQKKMSTRIPDKTELIPAHDWFNIYEEAVEAALKFALENLI